MLNVMAAGLDESIASMDAREVHAGVSWILGRDNSYEARALAVAILDLWRATHAQESAP